MKTNFRNIILCISFGHSSSQVYDAMRGALEHSRTHVDTLVVVADDCSGNPPLNIEGAVLLETPSRRGYSGVVNYVLETYPDVNGRILLINPDACLESMAVSELLSDAHGIAVPRVLNPAGELENIRRATNASEQLRALLFGERSADRTSRMGVTVESGSIVCPPYAPSGSVLAIPIQHLRSVPLRAEFFWLEQSDWVIRYSRMHGPVEVSVLPVGASHTGASTSLRYPLSVAASQLRTKINFVNEYGGFGLRLLLPLGVVLRAGRFAVKTRKLSNAWFLLRVAAGLADWRVSK